MEGAFWCTRQLIGLRQSEIRLLQIPEYGDQFPTVVAHNSWCREFLQPYCRSTEYRMRPLQIPVSFLHRLGSRSYDHRSGPNGRICVTWPNIEEDLLCIQLRLTPAVSIVNILSFNLIPDYDLPACDLPAEDIMMWTNLVICRRDAILYHSVVIYVNESSGVHHLAFFRQVIFMGYSGWSASSSQQLERRQMANTDFLFVTATIQISVEVL